MDKKILMRDIQNTLDRHDLVLEVVFQEQKYHATLHPRAGGRTWQEKDASFRAAVENVIAAFALSQAFKDIGGEDISAW
jgi:hypothetical protein